MSKVIQFLFVENEPTDAALVNHKLREAGWTFRLKRVSTRDAYVHELNFNQPDVILSDHNLPSFDGFTALALARERCPDVPFIFVTGGMGEEETIGAFENGAADCILKKDLSKLAPVVRRVLYESEGRLLRRAGDADRERLIGELMEMLKARNADFLLPICPSCKRIQDVKNRWQPVEHFFRDHFHLAFESKLCPDCTLKPGLELKITRSVV